MRNLQDSERFVRTLEKKINTWVQEQSQLFRSNVVDNSIAGTNSTIFRLQNLTLKDHMMLGIISWYIPENHGFILREDLRETTKYLNDIDRELVNLLLESKAQTLVWLIETSLWHERDFFGNILKFNRAQHFLRVRRESKKLRKLVRKRGYHDHGSRVADHKWKPRHDYFLTKKHYEIESYKSRIADTRDFIVGIIT